MDSSTHFVTPHTLTILCTYQCTAACRQCCFESSPRVLGRLDRQVILDRITEAKREFPTLRVVVFSGGEATILKQDLVEAIAHSSDQGLQTRIVSNASWGKTKSGAQKLAQALADAGLGELNISTGKDHQEWVSSSSVVNAAEAAVAAGISTLITVEVDDEQSSRLAEFSGNPLVRQMLATKRLILQSHAWMPFQSNADDREQRRDLAKLKGGCEQIFGNIVVTPHDNLSACCGLTLEHIPEMRLGRCSGTNLGELYRSQVEDFLKFWIHVDGPYTIIDRVLGAEASKLLDDVVHICQACVIMHREAVVIDAIQEKYLELVPEVMTRFHIKRAVEARSSRACKLQHIEVEEMA